MEYPIRAWDYRGGEVQEGERPGRAGCPTPIHPGPGKSKGACPGHIRRNLDRCRLFHGCRKSHTDDESDNQFRMQEKAPARCVFRLPMPQFCPVSPLALGRDAADWRPLLPLVSTDAHYDQPGCIKCRDFCWIERDADGFRAHGRHSGDERKRGVPRQSCIAGRDPSGQFRAEWQWLRCVDDHHPERGPA